MAPSTRDALVDAAAQLLDQGGPDAVTLREVGRRAGVSHNAPYKHFTGKQGLLAAVAVRELRRQDATAAAATTLSHLSAAAQHETETGPATRYQTQSRQNSLPSMSCITRHDSS